MNAMTPAEIVRQAYAAALGREVRVCKAFEASARTYAAGLAAPPLPTATGKPSASEVVPPCQR